MEVSKLKNSKTTNMQHRERNEMAKRRQGESEREGDEEERVIPKQGNLCSGM